MRLQAQPSDHLRHERNGMHDDYFELGGDSVVSIQLVAPVSHAMGWPAAFTMLAIGPVLGCLAMARLRASPESRRLAGGRR